MHYDIDSDFGGHYDDDSKSYRERLHLSTHYVTEDIGLGKEKIIIDFMSPTEFGYDKNKLNSEKESIICARVVHCKLINFQFWWSLFRFGLRYFFSHS